MAECHDAADRKIENKKNKPVTKQTQNGCNDKVTGIPTCTKKCLAYINITALLLSKPGINQQREKKRKLSVSKPCDPAWEADPHRRNSGAASRQRKHKRWHEMQVVASLILHWETHTHTQQCCLICITTWLLFTAMSGWGVFSPAPPKAAQAAVIGCDVFSHAKWIVNEFNTERKKKFISKLNCGSLNGRLGGANAHSKCPENSFTFLCLSSFWCTMWVP